MSNKLTLRGTEVNIFDYADFNEKLLGNESLIITRPFELVSRVSPRDVSPLAYKKFSDRFPIEYYVEPHDIIEIVKRNKIDILFIEKAGSPNDGLVFDCCKTIIHCVFTTNEPHGDLYAPISDALNTICNTNYPVLPYMIRVDDTEENLREQLGIPQDAIVFGSYSGADEYSNVDVKRAVSSIVKDDTYKNIYFIYLNIDRFGPESPRLKFLPGTADLRAKRMFINTCDAMLYARNGGETFGLACGEFSVCNKPIILCPGQHSNAHEVILGDKCVKFRNYDEVYSILTNWHAHKIDVSENGYKEYTPTKVMEIFNQRIKELVPNMGPSSSYDPNTIIFITAFKDIGRKDWSEIPRTNERYIQDFLNLARNISYTLVAYCEESMINKLKEYNLGSNIILLPSNQVQTFYDNYIEHERTMISSHVFQSKVPFDRKKAPEHWSADYTMVNHSKINYVRHTKFLYPRYEYYSWLDFGCIRNTIDDVPKNINFDKLHKKISYLALVIPPSYRITASDMVKSHDVYLAGSQFVTHRSLVEKQEELYRKLLEQWKIEIVCDEDQGAILQIYFEDRDLFELFPSKEWFSLFRNHLNTKGLVDISTLNFQIPTELCEILGRFGSDKGSFNITKCHHNYSIVYYNLFKSIRTEKLRIFELGLGTNDVSITSNMGPNGRPGASLYAWREFFPNSCIFGADIDSKILFEDTNIKTFYCDQTNSSIIENMWKHTDLTDGFDIIIDDGLHTFEANITFFENSIHKLKVNGYFIIEDILTKNIPRFRDQIQKYSSVSNLFTYQLLTIPSLVNNADNNMLVLKRER